MVRIEVMPGRDGVDGHPGPRGPARVESPRGNHGVPGTLGRDGRPWPRGREMPLDYLDLLDQLVVEWCTLGGARALVLLCLGPACSTQE